MPAMRILLGTVLVLGLIQKGLAREVDQFLAWGVELEDTGPTIDAYMRKHMADALEDINENRVREIPSGKNRSKKREEIPMEYFSCTTIAHDMMKKAFFQPTYQLIEEYLDNDPAIDRYPRRPGVEADDVRRDRGETVERGYMTDMEYLANSVVQKSPINTPLSRIVNAYGIYTGSDKFGHFTSFGVRYLDQMRDNILNGMNYDDAFFDSMGDHDGTTCYPMALSIVYL